MPLLFAGDIVLVANSKEKLCQLKEELGRVCRRSTLRMNRNKCKVIKGTRVLCWKKDDYCIEW